jgi:hypothetical protein
MLPSFGTFAKLVLLHLGIATNNFYICKVCGISCAKIFAKILGVVFFGFLKKFMVVDFCNCLFFLNTKVS